jgi:hypothetical protein
MNKFKRQTKVEETRINGVLVGYTFVGIPEGWGTPEFDAKFPPVTGESYLQKIRIEYGDGE